MTRNIMTNREIILIMNKKMMFDPTCAESFKFFFLNLLN